jgi:hypothetical protein
MIKGALGLCAGAVANTMRWSAFLELYSAIPLSSYDTLKIGVLEFLSEASSIIRTPEADDYIPLADKCTKGRTDFVNREGKTDRCTHYSTSNTTKSLKLQQLLIEFMRKYETHGKLFKRSESDSIIRLQREITMDATATTLDQLIRVCTFICSNLFAAEGLSESEKTFFTRVIDTCYLIMGKQHFKDTTEIPCRTCSDTEKERPSERTSLFDIVYIHHEKRIKQAKQYEIDFDREAKQIKTALNIAKQKANDAQEAIDEAQKAIDKAQKAIDKAQKAIDTAKTVAGIIEAQKAINEAQKVIDNAQKAIDAIAAQKAIDEAQVVIDNAQKAIIDNAQKAIIDNAQKAIRNAQTAIRNAQTAIRNAQTAIDKAQTAIDKAQTAIGNAQTAIGNAQTAIGNAQTAIGEAKTAKERQKAIGEAPKVIDEAQKAIKDAQKAIKDAQEAIKDAQEAIANKQREREAIAVKQSVQEAVTVTQGVQKALAIAIAQQAAKVIGIGRPDVDELDP